MNILATSVHTVQGTRRMKFSPCPQGVHCAVGELQWKDKTRGQQEDPAGDQNKKGN